MNNKSTRDTKMSAVCFGYGSLMVCSDFSNQCWEDLVFLDYKTLSVACHRGRV
jgi:hypothetical protein